MHDVDCLHRVHQTLDDAGAVAAGEHVGLADPAEYLAGVLLQLRLRRESVARFADVHRAELTGPPVHVLKQLVVDRLPVIGVERARHQSWLRDQLGRTHVDQHAFGVEPLGVVGQPELVA